MRFSAAIDTYISEQRAQGRINSDNTERDYRMTLMAHAEDVANRDPRYTNRDDVKRTLGRWSHPNSRAKNHAIVRSFYDWLMEEGLRGDNPARQVRRAKRRPASVYRLTQVETVGLLTAVRGARERRLIYLGVCAGLRRQELRGVQGRHFRRAGWVWVSPDIGKGAKERWVPVISDLEPVWREIRDNVADDEYVLPAQRFRDPGRNRSKRDYATTASSYQSIWRAVKGVGARAGIPAEIGPHTLRHAFCDHVARHAGMRVAQAVMGHAEIGTTEGYLGKPTLDELSSALSGLRIAPESERTFYPLAGQAVSPVEAPTGIEPVTAASRVLERFFASPAIREAARRMA